MNTPLGHPSRISAAEMARIFGLSTSVRAPGTGDNAILFYDLTRLDRMLDSLDQAFPTGVLHAVAVKANPVLEVLKRIASRGCGAEVASMGELALAVAAGFPTDAIVFDSPVKTRAELLHALRIGVRINANSLHELDRIIELRQHMETDSRVGLRINPAVGTGRIASTSVAIARSKFGVCLMERRDEVREAFRRYPWLTGLHVHVGSQGMTLEQLVEGVRRVAGLFVELREGTGLCRFNIGGGLPVQYNADDPDLTFGLYASALRSSCPFLFDGTVQLTTEFGRSIHAGNGWAASRIEYVTEHDEGSATLMVHVGADLFLRKVYRPEDWHHDLSVCDAMGRLRTGQPRTYQVAGPLCFSGDYLAREVMLPGDIQEGDYLLVHEAGAYTFSMWSLYNSRPFPAITGYENDGDCFVELIPKQETAEIVSFWSTNRSEREPGPR